jgi:DNA-binding phage protein
MPVQDLKVLLPNIQQRLGACAPFWSEIASRAQLGYATVEGLAKGWPHRCNPRFDTLCALLAALEYIEEREHADHGTQP